MESHIDGPVSGWLQTLQDSKAPAYKDDPNYWISNPESLVRKARVEQVAFGTGETIYKNTILPAIAAAEHEVILVTCFWARSPTLDAFSETLIALSDKALRSGRKIRVRICFSSLSLWQKLTQTSSLDGKVWAPKECEKRLGLPPPETLGGLDVEVRSVFVRPFCVMHPKFVIVDRKTVVLPSCNVSWEAWFEGAVVLKGGVVGQFVQFWSEFWARGESLDAGEDGDEEDVEVVTVKAVMCKSNTDFHWTISGLGSTRSVFLPSPHHRNPRFSLLPWRSCPPPPPTPLNTFILAILRDAREKIYIQTPNLTAPPVLSALLEALKRGVDVEILTSERLMILEQLVTAGTTTKRCVNALIKKHKRLLREYRRRINDWTSAELASNVRPGRLRILFFQPDRSGSGAGEAEPTQSHFKFMNVDFEWTVFGSGNMDRASWFTSQELGVAFQSGASAEMQIGAEVGACLERIMDKRRKLWYDGHVEEAASRILTSNASSYG